MRNLWWRWLAIMRGVNTFIADLRLLKYLVLSKRARDAGADNLWLYEEGEERKLEPLEPYKHYGRSLEDEDRVPLDDDLVYERSLHTGLLQLFFTRADGVPITNKRDAKAIFKMQNKALEAHVLQYDEACTGLVKHLQPILKAVTPKKYGLFSAGLRDQLLRKRRALYDFRRRGAERMIRSSISWHLRYQYVGSKI